MYDSIYEQMKILETKKFILRPLSLGDADDLFEYYKCDIVVKYLPFKPHKTVKETEHFIKLFFLDNYQKGKIGHFAIVYKKENKVIGNIGFNNIQKNSSEGELGICINPKYWGNDFSTELTFEMLKFGFEVLDLNKIIAIIFEDNSHSRKCLDVLGFKYVESFKKKMHSKLSPKYNTCYKFELSKNDYLKK